MTRGLSCCSQITARINKLCYGLDLDYVDPIEYLVFRLICFIFAYDALQGHTEGYRWCIPRRYNCRARCKYHFHFTFQHCPIYRHRTSHQRPLPTSPPNTLTMPCLLPVSPSQTYTKRPQKTFRSSSKTSITTVRVFPSTVSSTGLTDGLVCSEPKKWQAGGYDRKRDVRYRPGQRCSSRLCHYLRSRFSLQLVRRLFLARPL